MCDRIRNILKCILHLQPRQPRCRCRTLSLAEGWLRVVRPTQAPWCLRAVWVLGLQAPSAPEISGKIPKWFRQSFINAVVVKSITFDAFWSDHGGECFGEGSGRSVGRRRTRPDGLDANNLILIKSMSIDFN